MNPIIENLSLGPRNNRVQIQDNYYDFNVSLINSDGNITGIRHSAIVDLSFIEDMRYFYNFGFLIMDNTMDVLESAESISSGLDGAPQKVFKPFSFRNDGRDMLAINIKPQINYENADIGENKGNKNNSFALQGVFSVYETEDIITDNKNQKFLKMYFRDASYQLLREKDSYYNSGKVAGQLQSNTGGTTERGGKKLISNTERSVPTGIILRTILQQALASDTKLSQSFSSDWDQGSEKLFYSTPAGYKAIDDINYILKLHVSDAQNNYCPAILRHERSGVWTFKPLSKIAGSSYIKGTSNLGDLGGPGTIENFTIVRPSIGQGDNMNTPNRSPGFSPFANTFGDYSYAENFQSSGMNVDDAQHGMVTTMVHNYDFGQGQFNIDQKQNSTEAIGKTGGSLFVNNQKGITGKSPAGNLTNNLMRSENKNVKHEYNASTSQNTRLSSGRNQAMLLQFFNNSAISFRARGKTDRTVGKYITVKRSDSANDSPFDNKLQGSYCIVRIEHSFVNRQYVNEIIAVKNYNAAPSTASNKVL